MSRCLNCSVATNRMRRHIVTTLTPQLQNILTEWLSVQEDRRTNLQACYPCLMRAKRHLVLNTHRQVEELEKNEPELPEPPPLPPVANPTVAHEPPPPPPANNPGEAPRIHQMNYLPM